MAGKNLSLTQPAPHSILRSRLLRRMERTGASRSGEAGGRLGKTVLWQRIFRWILRQPHLSGRVGASSDQNIMRPLENVQFCSRSRKAKILTAGIHDKYFEDQNLSLTQKLGKRGRFPKVSTNRMWYINNRSER